MDNDCDGSVDEVDGEITDTDWHHVAMIKKRTGANTEYGVYLDGTQVCHDQENAENNYSGLLYVGSWLGGTSCHKGYSFINILGLAVGLACCIMIFLWVQDELSYDRFHENADDLYRVVTEYQKTEPVTHYWPVCAPLAPALDEEYPEIIKATRFTRLRRRQLIKYGKAKIAALPLQSFSIR